MELKETFVSRQEIFHGRIVDLPHSVGVSRLDAPPAYRAAEAHAGADWYAAISADIWGE